MGPLFGGTPGTGQSRVWCPATYEQTAAQQLAFSEPAPAFGIIKVGCRHFKLTFIIICMLVWAKTRRGGPGQANRARHWPLRSRGVILSLPAPTFARPRPVFGNTRVPQPRGRRTDIKPRRALPLTTPLCFPSATTKHIYDCKTITTNRGQCRQ